MNKRKRIKLLERELSLTDHALEQAEDDYQHTHDTMWKILQLLCNEFNMHLNVVPHSLLDEEHREPRDFAAELVQALDIADGMVPHSPKQDDAMDDVWELVEQYRRQQ